MKNKKEVSIGSWITLGHFSIAEIMADAGFDWLCVDIEHSVIDFYDLEVLIATIQSKGVKPFVRVGDNDDLIIKRVLDAGAEGIIIPMINSKSEAKKAIRSIKYAPEGSRGVGLARAQGYGFNFEEYAAKFNNKIQIIAQVEHINAIKNLDEILSLEELSGTIIGPYDLSASIGKPGQYNDPDVKKLLNQYENISKKFDKHMGYHVIEPNAKIVQKKIKDGYSFIALSLDTMFLGNSCRRELKELKG